MAQSHPTRVLVVGAGAFGRNHLRVWRELQQLHDSVHLAGIVETNPVLASQLQTEFQLPVYASIQDLLRSGALFDAASVAVPTADHAIVAGQLLRAGIDVLVEKPLAASLAEADALVQLAQHHGRILQVGHLEQFNPAILAVRPLVQRPLFFEIHRLSVFTPRSLDIDVVLDLMIHDLDLVLSFTQSPIRELHAVGLPVLSSKIDIANVRIEFASGCVANFTASRVSTEKVRKLRFFQPHQYVSIDYARQDVLCVDVSPQQAVLSESIPYTAQAARFLPVELHHPTPGFTMRKLDIVPGEPLKLELEAFLRAVRERSQPRVTGTDGRAALAVALDIVAAIQAHQQRAGLA